MSDIACVFIELIDDEIAESTEIFIFNVTANNTLDQVVNGTATIEVADNDGIINCMMLLLKIGKLRLTYSNSNGWCSHWVYDKKI